MEENLYLKQNITMVVPTIPKDVHKFLANIDVYFELLPISSICVVGNEELHSMLPSDDRIKYVSEDSLVDFNKIKNLIIRRSNNICFLIFFGLLKNYIYFFFLVILKRLCWKKDRMVYSTVY